MTTQRPPYHDNDVGPFASPAHSLVFGGPGPQEVDVDMRDRDVMLNVEVDKRNIHLLHLQNVREDTVPAAQAAVEDFLDQLKSIDDDNNTHTKRLGHTMLEDFDDVHKDLRTYIEAQAKNRGLLFEWQRGGFPRKAFRNARSQPKYFVRFCEDGSSERRTGSRAVPSWQDRVPPGSGESDDQSKA